ncbi:hypothetical protein BKA67DRAFT_369852 [Truncatella angustata]|uniref:Uncharacterized protein n=1 Tax=Truncatella angustata TaxID=152316 RepID=A0A9P8UF08_9PEZI|nr:uncharacterized protein BKA67DRAFT_369852 [Truncatella angustata]KAH6648670.1 hypothetical protein BKA67DRAFT_369852 [Truncatella angustata]
MIVFTPSRLAVLPTRLITMILPIPYLLGLSYQGGLQTDSAYIEAANTIYLAIATRSDADAIMSSIDGEGFLNGDYTTADWYKTGVPTSAQSEFATVIASFKAVETSVLGETGAAATTATAKATATGSSTVKSAASGSGTASGASASSTSASTAGAHRSMATGGAVAGLAAAIAVGVMY